MRLIGGSDHDENDGLEIDMNDADTQELEATAYRFVQITPDRCEKLAKEMAQSGINHPVIFECDVADPFGLSIARKLSNQTFITQALQETPKESRPGIIEGIDLEILDGKEPTIYGAIRDRMTGIIGYFPIVVAACGGFSVFPWPFSLKEKSKFMLFPKIESNLALSETGDHDC